MDADHQEDIEKLNAGFQEWESDYTDQERSMGFEVRPYLVIRPSFII